MPSLALTLCLLGLSSAQNIYDGCGVDKDCLGYEPDNPTENACLETQVKQSFKVVYIKYIGPEKNTCRRLRKMLQIS